MIFDCYVGISASRHTAEAAAHLMLCKCCRSVVGAAAAVRTFITNELIPRHYQRSHTGDVANATDGKGSARPHDSHAFAPTLYKS